MTLYKVMIENRNGKPMFGYKKVNMLTTNSKEKAKAYASAWTHSVTKGKKTHYGKVVAIVPRKKKQKGWTLLGGY